ncbi:uncharacterized protein LOC121811545 [Salvia splendens]|uniref:uncharacterized protein LOC121811545 n=1 Tax=Salvia splendens TaxID=180675 RepID=UPI001C27ADDF|nr:uncharacterized protein LOC121811545 [Salvia splendens]
MVIFVYILCIPLNSYIIICFLQILLDDVKISEQLIDLVFYLLVLLGPYRHVDIFIEAEFAAVCVDVKFLQTNDSFGSAFPTTEETLNHICQSVILSSISTVLVSAKVVPGMHCEEQDFILSSD